MQEEDTIELSYFSAVVIALVDEDIRRLTWLTIGLFFLLQALSYEFKILLDGYAYIAYFDIVAMGALTLFYLYYAKLIGTFFAKDYYEEDAIEVHSSGEGTQKVQMSVDMQGVEEVVVGLYKETNADPTTVIASLSSIVGATLLATGSNSVRVDRAGMEIQIVVRDVEGEDDGH